MGMEIAYTIHMKQLALIPNKKFAKRKCTRAISIRGYNHVVLKAHKPILRKNTFIVRQVFAQAQMRYRIRIKALSIMPNHIHVAIKTPTREAFSNFLRMIAGQIALRVAREKLWKQRAWSCVVKIGRHLDQVCSYIWNNSFKAKIFSSVDFIYIKAGIVIIE